MNVNQGSDSDNVGYGDKSLLPKGQSREAFVDTVKT